MGRLISTRLDFFQTGYASSCCVQRASEDFVALLVQRERPLQKTIENVIYDQTIHYCSVPLCCVFTYSIEEKAKSRLLPGVNE